MSEKWKQKILLVFPFAILAAGMILSSAFFLHTYRQIAFEHTSALCETILANSPEAEPQLLAALKDYHSLTEQELRGNDYLEKYGYQIIEPASGHLACGDSGKGKMPEPDELLSWVLKEIAYKKDLTGKKILVTAGPTQESIDPVRFITNHSSGKMGYAIARAAMLRGADVTLVSGPVSIAPPPFVRVVPVLSAEDMFQAVTSVSGSQDAIIKAAAVADYTPLSVSDQKVKKKDGEMSIELKRTKDILKFLGEHKPDGQFLCGFSMETENMLRNSRKKLEQKHVDMIVANSLRTSGAGFGTDTNVVTLITRDGEEELPLMSKEEVAHQILNRIFPASC